MPEFNTRQKWLGIVTVAILTLVAGTAFLSNRIFFGPTPEEARAALAERRLCAPDAPIVENRFGEVTIGNWECNLWGRTVRNGMERGKFGYVTTSDSAKWAITEGMFFAQGPFM